MAGRDYYESFDKYAADFPEAEKFRNFVCGGPRPSRDRLRKNPRVDAWWRLRREKTIIFRGEGPHGGLPGGYLWGKAYANPVIHAARAGSWLAKIEADPDQDRLLRQPVDRWLFQTNFGDNDDGLITKKCATYQEALNYLDWAKAQAPVSLRELAECFSFSW